MSDTQMDVRTISRRDLKEMIKSRRLPDQEPPETLEESRGES
jgi:hypothetical protein